MTNHEIEKRKTDETRRIETDLRAEFPNSEAYRFNSGSIRVRVIDERFRGLEIDERDGLVSAILDQLPEPLQRQIILVLTLTPEESGHGTFDRHSFLNIEFENPSPSLL